MIIKNIDPKKITNKFEQSGFNAEKQMAFYLERAFEKYDDILIINDLRLEGEKNFAQIDHLILHEYGFIIIESKSVSSQVSVNEKGEWIRVFNNKKYGMPSPINQAKRQITFLIDLLNEKAIHIRRDSFLNIFKERTRFSEYKNSILVAISDNGIIERNNNDITEVMKADAIAERIINGIKSYKEVEKSKFLNENTFSKETLLRIANLLVELHEPINKENMNKQFQKEVFRNLYIENKYIEPINYKTIQMKENDIKEKEMLFFKKDLKNKKCFKCMSENIQINYSNQFGYIFKCLDCNSNSKIELKCKSESCKLKIRKQLRNFYQVCDSCNKEILYFQNK